MVKLVDKQNVFNSGILSSKLYSRDDLKQYNNGVSSALNFICSRYGPMDKRTGTNFIWDLGNPDQKVFFLPFIFSIKQTVLLEFLDKKIRFYAFNGTDFAPIKNNATGTAYEISTPFTEEQIENISYAQSLDVIYLAFADGKTPPYTLSRYGNDNWKLDEFVTEDGPYLDQNYDTSKKMTIKDKNQSGSVSTIELTGFILGKVDEKRWLRICTPRYNENTYAYEDKWSYGRIESVSEAGDSITVKWSYRSFVDDKDQNGNPTNDWMTTATSEWRLGVWHGGTSDTKNLPVTYPKKVAIHQQRLVWAGTTDKPWVWMSNSFAYRNFAPMDYEGTIADSNAISYDISTDKVSEIFWVKSVKSLLIGTEMGEIRMYSSGTALTPSDVVSNRESSYGSYDGEPVVNDDNIVFIQRLQRTVRSLSYDYNMDAFVGPELTVLSDDLTIGGIKKIVFQKEPNNTYWCLKEDGTLLTLTYDKAQDVIGWSRSIIAGTDVKVIDIAVLPSHGYQQDMLLLAVERKINGEKRRYLELLSRNFIQSVESKAANFLDCAMRISDESPFDFVEGLDHLEGEEVRVMDEGAVQGDYIVKNGRIDFDSFVRDVNIGLPYDAYLETLERDFQDKQLSTKMSKLRIYKLRMYIERTLGVELYRLDNGSRTKLITFDPSKKTDETPELLTGKFNIEVPSAWDCDYRLRLESEPGLPCTLAGLIIGVEVNEL